MTGIEWLGRYIDAARAAGPTWLWSTGMTDWGRDPEMWPHLLALIPAEAHVWCAGIATGEEPPVLAARTPDSVHITATDVRDDALAAARAGRYPRGMVDGALDLGSVTLDDVHRMFPEYGRPSEWLHASETLLSRITWSRLDLTADRYPRAEVVLCRNVLHMIAAFERADVVDRLAAAHVPVIVGKSDRAHMDAYWRERFAETPSTPLILRAA